MTEPTDLTTCPDEVLAPSGEQLLDANPAPTVIIDEHYTIVAVNRSYCQHYRVGREDVIGRHCHEVSHGLSTPCSEHGEQCPLEAAIRTGQPVHVLHVHRQQNGSEERVQLDAVPVRGSSGAVRWVSETVNKIADAGSRKARLIGGSQPLLHLTDLLLRVAATDTTVLLLGESGTGKERAAEFIHDQSRRAGGPFVVFDCGGFSESLLESELFGYEKGAFTGAAERKLGLFEAASGGTLFIDEIGDLPLALQGRLLRVLETNEVRRVGGTEYVAADVRIVAATNRDLESLVRDGLFRADLLFRLSAFPVRVPTLRERIEDIPALASEFLASIRGGSRHLPLSREVSERLATHSYPGNVRELRNVIERAVILADRGALRPEHIVFDAPTHYGRPASANAPAADLMRPRGRPSDDEILTALAHAGGHRTRAARDLGISERTLYRYLTRIPRVDP